VLQTLTAANGSYNFGPLPSDAYALQADSPGHVLEWFDSSPTVAGRTIVNLGPGDDQPADFALNPTG
jgi:hypothetical protein